jgi:hypothetical protein
MQSQDINSIHESVFNGLIFENNGIHSMRPRLVLRRQDYRLIRKMDPGIFSPYISVNPY